VISITGGKFLLLGPGPNVGTLFPAFCVTDPVAGRGLLVCWEFEIVADGGGLFLAALLSEDEVEGDLEVLAIGATVPEDFGLTVAGAGTGILLAKLEVVS
jgi:hypothetical protein